MPWANREPMNQRSEFVLRAKGAENFRALCREYGISARVGYKWLKRYEEEGLRGMAERSRRPRSSGRGLAEEVVCRIVRLKERHRHWGARKLREGYRRSWSDPPSESSFKRVLERCGMVEKPRIRKAAEERADRRWTARTKAERSVDGGLQGVVERCPRQVHAVDGA